MKFIKIKSSQCFCGDTYGKHGPGLESSCSMKCLGDNTQICGGFGRNSVYEIVPDH